MGYKTPTYKQPTKYPDSKGMAVETTRVRLPVYLLAEIEMIAQEIHQRRLAEGTVPQKLTGGDRDEP
ncbi:MAG: hypothetical protein KME60_03570 [Cyanomargarita calcarea GSE-NOS-MK-12-04C]|jgi:hypothetical protein|uniref:Uncharacterized protein n=1 Tax=Cyanomargarita calcarea GSE-NOS-MK-12-04C TaxID=2839659 RepID=A0A951URT1_9CYAN|nr:hypothetical protein [Cyanomargarita calcarea GSE-NOS-MK-12-04C]